MSGSHRAFQAQNNRLSPRWIVTLTGVTVHVCYNDGAPLGQFMEADFRDKIFVGELTADCFYWYEGMDDWKPISEYRPLAKTQRIEVLPEPTPPAASEEIRVLRPRGSEALLKGIVVGAIGLMLIVIGAMSSSYLIIGLGAALLLFGVYLGVAPRVKS